MHVKVTGTNFVRDIDSKVLLNNNVSEKEEYYNKVKVLQNQKKEINKINGEIDNLRNELTEIKYLLQQLLKNKE